MFSEIKVWPVKNNEKIKANGRVTINDLLSVSFTIRVGANGIFVGLPGHSGKDKEGNNKWYSDVFIKDKKVLEDLNEQVLKVYNGEVGDEVSNQGEAAGPDNQDTIPF